MSGIEFLEKASKAYYDGSPFITDEEYDALEAIHGQIISGRGEIAHARRMYSLKKHYDKDGAFPLDISKCVKTPKLDGMAVSLLYVGGVLISALTRGDGIKGRDITEKVKRLSGVPHKLETYHNIIQVTGEVVASKEIPNSRNYASGALNQKDIEVFLQRKTDGNMRFVAYGVQKGTGFGITESYKKDMTWLLNQGVSNILYPPVLGPIHDNTQIEYTPWEDLYPTDGTVYRLESNIEFANEGHTDKFPRGAFAYKQEQESAVTTLLNVEWETGKSGKVTPVAILESVEIDGANIARATLNNIAYIEALDLEIGCKVKVIRAGEIIPKIIGRA